MGGGDGGILGTQGMLLKECVFKDEVECYRGRVGLF